MSKEAGRALSVDLVIVGGGPAGLAAAVAAAELGVGCLLIERSSLLGGQIEGVHPEDPSLLPFEPEVEQVKRLRARLAELDIGLITDATVWHVESSYTLHLVYGGSNARVECQALLVATGASERPMPFTGWTLPGVMTAGAAQRLAAQAGIAPGRRVMVAGRGPLLLRCAAQLVEAGGNVVAVVEATPLARSIRKGLAVLGHSKDKARQAYTYVRTLRKAGIPLLCGHAVVEAAGDGQVERAVTAPLDRNGRPRDVGERMWAVDAVCVSNGLEPNIRLCQALGCELTYDPQAEAFFPHHDEVMRTSLPRVYVAGEVAGIGGAAKSLAEGEIAGVQIATDLGFATTGDLSSRLRMLAQQRQVALRQARAIESAFVRPGRLMGVARPDTIICRCEEITLEALRTAISTSDGSPRDIKARTRAGMGMCQGRMCVATVYHELTGSTGQPPDPARLLRIRPPLEPIPLEQLAELDIAG